jgi:hypothetical protein
MESNINLWPSYVMPNETEVSLSQIWVVGNANSMGSLQTAEAGVQVYPSTYGSNAGLRLFIYYTADNYA